MLNICSHSVWLLGKSADVFCIKKIVLVITPSNLRCKMCSTWKFWKNLTTDFLLLRLPGKKMICSARKKIWKSLTLSLFLGLPGKYFEYWCVMQENLWIFWHLSSFSSFLSKFLCVLQNNLSNLSFLAGAEQLIRKTPPLAASVVL